MIRNFSFDPGSKGSCGRGEFVSGMSVRFYESSSFSGLADEDIEGQLRVVVPFFVDFFDSGKQRNGSAYDGYVELGHGYIEYPTTIGSFQVVDRLSCGVLHVLLGQPPAVFYECLKVRIAKAVDRHLASEADQAAIEQYAL